jgi:N-alpha-acetyl-L-2,4-diaminobutyrate deacetylase
MAKLKVLDLEGNNVGEIDVADVEGRIILVPVLNPPAFRAGTRESRADDGVNLNRAFIEGAGRTPALAGITHRIAAFVREAIWPHVHVVIDLHSGGGTRFAQVASFHEVEDPAQARDIEETARWFGTPLVMSYQNETPGLLPSEAERLGKITVGTELGWGEAVQANGVRWGRQGVLAAAIRHGQLGGRIDRIDHHRDGTQRKVAMVDRACFSVAPFGGLYEEALACGSEVMAGDVLVQSSAHGARASARVRAEGDSVVVQWQTPQRRVAPGQTVVFYDGTDRAVLGGGIAVD